MIESELEIPLSVHIVYSQYKYASPASYRNIGSSDELIGWLRVVCRERKRKREREEEIG